MSMHGLPQGVINPPKSIAGEAAGMPGEEGAHGRPIGTLVLVFVFLAAFVLYYFVNWKLLSLVWRIG